MKPETKLQAKIMLSVQHLCRIFRNNVGFDAVRKVRYGLCRGSSDLIGWTRYRIRPDDVGRQVAVFTALEVKRPKRYANKEQRNFLERLAQDGGIAVVAKSEEQAVRDIECWGLGDVSGRLCNHKDHTP